MAMQDVWVEDDYGGHMEQQDDGQGTGVDNDGFNPVTDLPEANRINIGSDVYYRNADGSYTGTNTETGESFSVTPEQMGSLVTPESTGNASMADLKGAAYIAKLNDPNWVTKINNMFGSNLTKNDLMRIAAVTGGGLAGLSSLNKPSITKVGYQGGLPNLEAQRTMETAPVAGLRPGAGGTNYGGAVQYTDPAAHAAAPAAPVQTIQPSAGIAANPYAGKMKRDFATPVNQQTTSTGNTATASDVMTPEQLLQAQQTMQYPTVKAAQGGIMEMAHGGRYLQGETDGMADKLRTSIDGKQPAALSHGEFVIPADVVSHLGNGNSDAGAKKLYSMMDKIRQARTGSKKQGKQINPDKFMPGGLAAAYAGGGSVMGFAGETGSYIPAGTTGVDQTLAGWTGNYAPNMLAKTQALTSTAMPQYTGTLTAGASDLQNQAFAGASENAQAGYTPTQFTSGTFDANAANKYMNPYLQASLNPQIEEARRQSQIDQQLGIAGAIKSGGFGGGAGDIMSRAANRDLGSKLSGIVGAGYNTAYDKAMGQFNAEQNRGLDTQKASEESRQFGANYGIKSLDQLAGMGATQRGIESEGIAADKKAFEDARNAPYEQLKFQSQMLSGLPIQATNYSKELPSILSDIASGTVTVNDAMKRLGL
jgi:hypothetical protein